MLGILVAVTVLLILLSLRWKQIQTYLEERWRFYQLCSKLPGPSFLTMLSELPRLSLDSETFTYQAEALFRKFAYKEDTGILRCWFGPYPIVVLTRAKSAKVILESTTLINKPDEYDIFKRLVGNGMLSSSGEIWFKTRRMLTPAFYFGILNKYIEVFNVQSRILIEKLEKHCGTNETFDLLPYLRRYGLDTIAETAMGVQINAQNGGNEEYYQSLKKALSLMWAKIRYPWFWFAPIRWLYGYDKKLDECCNICKRLTRKIIAEKKKEWEAFDRQPSMAELSAAGKKKLAFMDLLFSIREEYKLTDEDICDQVDMFMAAGSDAVTAQIGFNLFALGHRQHIQGKVYKEIKEVLGESDRDLDVDDINNLHYLYQCICETGRITPNVVFMGRKITEDTQICGYTLPAGVTCALSPFAIMRDPLHYENPEEYDPEHFSEENVAKRDPFSFIPFSAGIRNCIGQRFAILEMKVTLALILRKYRVISMISEKDNRPIPEFSLKPSKGFPIRLERR